MSTINNKIQKLEDGVINTYHPETNTEQVYDFTSGKWLDELLLELQISQSEFNAHKAKTASTTELGLVRVDGETILIDENGVISSIGDDTQNGIFIIGGKRYQGQWLPNADLTGLKFVYNEVTN